MGDLRYRVTLSHSQAGSKQISEPEGWKDIKMVLDRDPEYASLIELFEVPLIFYRSNGEHDGGMDYILAVESGYGIDENVGILFEVSEDEIEWDVLWDGLLNFETFRELDSRRLQMSLLRNDGWSKFKNREDTPVDVFSESDLDGNTVDTITPQDLLLTGQTVNFYGVYEWKESTRYVQNGLDGIQMDWDTVIKDDIRKFTIPRARVSNTTESGILYSGVAPLFEAPWDGDYLIECKFTFAEYVETVPPKYAEDTINARLLLVGQPFVNGIQFSTTIIGPFGVDGDTYAIHEISHTLTLRKGDQVIIAANRDIDVQIFGTVRYSYKTDADLATTANITLSGEQVIDGTLTSTSRVLVKHQGNAAENGIYNTSAGAWTRVSDLNTASEANLAAVYVTNGDVNGGSAFKQTADVGIIDVDAMVWEFFIHSYERTKAYNGPEPVENYLRITAMTTYEDTTVEGLLIHDGAAEVVKRIVPSMQVISDTLGSQYTQSRLYNDNGCWWNNMLVRGLNLRGYSIAEKAFFISFKDWWMGANPIFNLGLSYETFEGNQVIRIEEKSYFFDPDPILNLNWVNNIIRTYDKDNIYKRISIGYEEWQAEDTSGLDDPQTKKTYATRFEVIGTEKTIYSKFIAAALAIEVTRRKTIDQSMDYKFDNKVFIISVNPGQLSSPDNLFIPELDENFSDVTGINNPESRYNLFLTPMRNFFRWMNFFNGALTKYIDSYYKFTSGEGNYQMVSDYKCNTGDKANCQGTICDEIGENEDISIINYYDTIGHLFTPEVLEFEHPLTWSEYKQIRDNRTKAIGVSTTDADHIICFIKRIEYDINKSKAKFIVWKR